MEKKLKGKAWVFGDHIEGDKACQFFRNRDISLKDKKGLAGICMTGYDPDFPKKAQRGDIIFGGRNFGCGQIHIHFYASLKALGISALVLQSANDRFWREAVNRGITVFFSPKKIALRNGEEVEIDLDKGKIFRVSTGESVEVNALPPLVKEIFEKGSIDYFIKSRRKD